jgi:hypothetical protein
VVCHLSHRVVHRGGDWTSRLGSHAVAEGKVVNVPDGLATARAMITNDDVKLNRPTVQQSCAAFEFGFLIPIADKGTSRKLRERSIQLEVKQPSWDPRGSFSQALGSRHVAQVTFAHDTLIRLVDAPHAVLKLTVSLWQFLGDSACPSWNVQVMGGIKKHSLTDLEFINRHGVPHANRIHSYTICAASAARRASTAVSCRR